MIEIHLATAVSPWLGGRYREQGNFSGEAFRDDVLIPLLRVHDVAVDLDGIEGPSPGFFDEALGAGLVEAVGPGLAELCTVVGVKNAHLVKMVMGYRAEALQAVEDRKTLP